MPITLDGTNGITTPMYNGSITANAVTPSVNMKNRLINGGMAIDQRNVGASVTANGGYYLDRWEIEASQSSKLTIQQQTSVVPTGFTYATSIGSSSSYSVGTSDSFTYRQIMEGFNVADLGWGTANAQTVTLSFWVRSSLTGTFGGAFCNGDNDRSYPFTYTISAANTWEQKTVTVAGDTTGTWGKTNGRGIQVRFGLGAGSTYSGTAGAWTAGDKRTATGAVSVVGTNGATWYLTGVQFEIGSVATNFDYRPYGTELQLCQRYCQIVALGNEKPIPSGWTFSSSTEVYTDYQLTPPMRTAPTLAQTAAGYRANSASFNGNSSSSVIIDGSLTTETSARLALAGFSGATGGQGTLVRTYAVSSTAYFGFVAEM